MRYELWHSESDRCHTFIPASQHPGDLPEDPCRIWTVEGPTWEAAQAAKHVFLGWEPYQPRTNSTSTHSNP